MNVSWINVRSLWASLYCISNPWLTQTLFALQMICSFKLLRCGCPIFAPNTRQCWSLDGGLHKTSPLEWLVTHYRLKVCSTTLITHSFWMICSMRNVIRKQDFSLLHAEVVGFFLRLIWTVCCSCFRFGSRTGEPSGERLKQWRTSSWWPGSKSTHHASLRVSMRYRETN